MAPHDDVFITTGDAARELGCSPALVHWLERKGQLKAVRTNSGIRLFERKHVRALAADRRERRRRG